MHIATAAAVRTADQRMADEFALPTLLLMEAAGRRAAEFLRRTYPDIRHFLVLAGTGNNGGDGLVAARYLLAAGCVVWVVQAGDATRCTPDTATNLTIVHKAGIPVSAAHEVPLRQVQDYLRNGCIVVDALLGTGGSGPLRAPAAEVVERFRQLPVTVVALDLPSGLNADSGEVHTPPLRAEHTLAFQLPKMCHYVTPAASYCGQVHVLDIGIYPQVLTGLALPAQVLSPELVRGWYRPRTADSHKGTYGHVLLAGGSRGKAGAIALSTQSALEIGAGLATAFIPGSTLSAFHRTNLENMSVPYGTDLNYQLNDASAEVFLSYVAGKQVLALGPGLGATEATYGFLRDVLAGLHALPDAPPLLLDADALNLLAEHPDLWAHLPPHTVLTPHPGEMARLRHTSGDDIQARRLHHAQALAAERNVLVVLKGAGTLVAAPDGTVFVNAAGNPGMATAGTGDVLTGAIAGLVAQGYPLLQAAAMGVYLHARAGDRVARVHGVEGLVASKLMRALGGTLKEVVEGRSKSA